MKGLRKMIFPFAPDQSGAAAVFYDLGGMIVICDAGGCAGNICGFDEPRWFEEKSAVFSAGLRDMDAILGRDDRMVEKMADAAQKLDVKFAAVIGTPVPATIATDYHAVRRMAEKRIGIPVMTVPTNGIRLYDQGASDAYLELFRTFTQEKKSSEAGAENAFIGVLGALPLDCTREDVRQMQTALQEDGCGSVVFYGAGCSLDDIRLAGQAKRNIVTAPCGLAAARYLQERFHTPFTCEFPHAENAWSGLKEHLDGKKVLIVHQQILANELRNEIRKTSDAEVTAASWFQMDPNLMEACDLRIREEDDFVSLVENGGYDVIIGDPSFQKACRRWSGEYRSFPHFAVSGIVS